VPDDRFRDALGHCRWRAFLLEEVEDEQAAVELEAKQRGGDVGRRRADVVQQGCEEVCGGPGLGKEGREAEARYGEAWGR
jgi:hypothetical protein